MQDIRKWRLVYSVIILVIFIMILMTGGDSGSARFVMLGNLYEIDYYLIIASVIVILAAENSTFIYFRDDIETCNAWHFVSILINLFLALINFLMIFLWFIANINPFLSSYQPVNFIFAAEFLFVALWLLTTTGFFNQFYWIKKRL